MVLFPPVDHHPPALTEDIEAHPWILRLANREIVGTLKNGFLPFFKP